MKTTLRRITSASALGLVLAIIAMCTVSCNKTKSPESALQLEQIANMMPVPVKMADGSTLSNCYYDNNRLTYRYEVSADTLKGLNLDSLKSVTLNNLVSGKQRNLVQHLLKANASVRYIYVSGEDSVVFSFSPADFGAKKRQN